MLLDYKDVCLIPKVISEIESRNDVNTNIKFGNLNLTFPIIAAPMPDVCNGEMALKLSENGGLGIIHRFQSIESQVAEFNLVGPTAGAAIGINGDWEARFNTLVENGCSIFCIDVANGASKQLIKVVDKLQILLPKCYIIAGNVASAEGYKFLCNIGVDGVRTGIAGGKSCATKIETGVYSPMFSLMKEIRECKEKYGYKAAIIADGSIKIPADMNKALCYADICMAGSIFAGTDESPGNVMKDVNGNFIKLFRGAASFSTQKYEAGKKPTYVEGLETFVPYTGSVNKVIERFVRGLRSSMTYFNSQNLTEYRKNVTWGILS